MTMKRVCLIATDQNEYDAEYNISVDLKLADNGIPSRKMTAFGVRGSLAPDSPNEPFILREDGSGDFGSHWDDEERDFGFNIRGKDRVVARGELFTFTQGDEAITYRVTEIIDVV